MRRRSFFLLFTLILFPALAFAGNEPKALGTFGDWSASVFIDGGSKVCFMSSAPVKQEGKFKKRGKVFFFITHWAGEKAKNEISISTGYVYKPGSDAIVKVDDQEFKLFTGKEGEASEMAWARDPATDEAIAAAIQKGSAMTVKGTSKRGTLTEDTYSLKGSGAAYEAITKECEG